MAYSRFELFMLYAALVLVIVAGLALPFMVAWAKHSSDGMTVLATFVAVISVIAWYFDRR